MNNSITRFITRWNNHISQDYQRQMRAEVYRALMDVRSVSDSSIGVNRDENRETEIILSLTTYGDRIYTVHKTIQSLMMQTMKADRIMLWLSNKEYKEGEETRLPCVLKKMRTRGLEIKYCDDYKSYKKLVPTISICPNAIIITVDDDMIYPFNLVEELVATSYDNPGCVVFTYGKKMSITSSGEFNYEKWPYVNQNAKASHKYMGIGVGGILYPPHSLFRDITNSELFFKLAPHADDLWFKIMAYMQGTPYVPCHFGYSLESEEAFLSHFVSIEEEQAEKLGTVNVINGQNEIQLKQIIEYYKLSSFEEILKDN